MVGRGGGGEVHLEWEIYGGWGSFRGGIYGGWGSFRVGVYTPYRLTFFHFLSLV